MGNRRSRAASMGERAAGTRDALRATFGVPAAVAMACGLVVGFGLPAIDEWLEVDMPLFVFSTQDAARSMLETIATVTVAVAGLSFSVTIIAFTLSSNQLSPRVLRSFRRDRLSQLTLAAFLGTFIYCLSVLVRLGTLGPERVPNLSVTVAVLLALLAFGLFAAFIGHITNMLQPSSVIASIADDARAGQERPYPTGIAADPEDPQAAAAAAERLEQTLPSHTLRSDGHGFLTFVRGDEAVELAARGEGVVRQLPRIGDYLLPGDPLAVVSAPSRERADELAEALGPSFELGRQRTLPQDPGFPVRQLADVALKGLSPGINDPTTARNAMEALTAGLIRFARAPAASPVRVDDDGGPRLVVAVPSLDDLVRLGFEQVRAYASSDQTFLVRLLELLERVSAVAAECGLSHVEAQRQAALIRADADEELGAHGAAGVRAAHDPLRR